MRHKTDTWTIVNRCMVGDGTHLELCVENDQAIVSSVLSVHGDDSDRYRWRLSGHDLKLHAFRVEGGYVEPRAALAILETGNLKDEELISFGPYEVWVAECGYMLPIAMVLPQCDGNSCVGCRVSIESPRREAPAAPTVRDWSKVEPLRQRRNAGARGKLAPVAEIQL